MQINRWKGVDGIERSIKDMSPMHLAMVCKQLENGGSTFDEYKSKDFGARLINTSLTQKDWLENIKLIRAGKYSFYDDGGKLDSYYTKLVNNYKAFLAPKCLQFKEHFDEWIAHADEAIDYYTFVEKDEAAAHQLKIAKTKSCADNWFEGRYELIKAAASIPVNVDNAALVVPLTE